MADIQYLNYGNLQIELLALMNSLANNVQNYVNSQSWSKKRKEKFMSAYSDLINRGIVGASNETGLWLITVNGGDIDFSNKDKKDKEMYNEAAYFIQQLMASLPTRTTTTPEEDKSKLQLFDNDYFNKSFTLHLSNGIAGGGDIQIGGENDMWDYLDKRDEKTGLRGRTERAKKLAEYLKSYSDSLEEGKYNFEGTAFSNLSDFKSKVGKAIEALNTDNLDDDYPALNAIGLKNPQQYFYNGSNDPFKTNGYEGTYGDYYGTYLPGLLKKKAEEEVQRKKLNDLYRYNNTTFLAKTNPKMFGKNPQLLKEMFQNNDLLMAALNQYLQSGLSLLTGEDLSIIHGTYKYLAKDPIDDKTFNTLINSSSGLYKNAARNRFRKINGIDGYVWDTIGQLVIQLQSRQLHEASNILSRDLFQNVKTKEEQELINRLQAGDRKLFSKYTNQDGSIDWLKAARNGAVDISRLVAIGDDIGAAIASFIPGYGTAASAAFSTHGLLTELFADMADESVSKLDVAKNAGINALFAALGLIPGGKIPKIGKSLGKIGKMAIPLTGAIMSTTAGYSLLSDPEVKKSWNKVLDMNLDDLSNKDLLNILHVLGAGVGILQGGRGIRNAAKYGGLTAKTLKNQVIKTTKGEVKINDPQQLTQLNKIGRTKGTDKANNYLNETIIGDANAGHEVLVNFNTSKLANSKFNPLRFIMSPEVKAETKIVPGSLTEAQRSRLENLRLLDEAYKNGKGLGRIIPKSIRENLPTDYDLWVGTNFGRASVPTQQKKKPTSLLNTLKLLPNLQNQQKLLPNPQNVTKGRNITSVGTRPQTYTIRQNLRELNALLDDYGISGLSNVYFGARSKRPITNQHTGTYDVNKPLTDGTYNLNTNGTNITFSKQNGKVTVTFNGIKKEFKNLKELENLVLARLYLARLLINESKNDISKTAEILRGLKAKGVFKQGGRIDRQKIQKYKEFINK